MGDYLPTDPSTDWLTSLINSTANAYATIKQADALKAQQLGTQGYYLNGQFVPNSQAASGSAIPAGWLMIGAAVLVFVLMKD